MSFQIWFVMFIIGHLWSVKRAGGPSNTRIMGTLERQHSSAGIVQIFTNWSGNILHPVCSTKKQLSQYSKQTPFYCPKQLKKYKFQFKESPKAKHLVKKNSMLLK